MMLKSRSGILKMPSNRIIAATWLILLTCLATIARADVTLNEIMFDPDGDESTDEFVELHNNGIFAISINGWRVTDGVDTDRIVAVEQGLIAGPNQYILILDPDYLDQGSTTYDGLVPENALVVTIDNPTFGSRGLSNSSSETVSLIDAAGHVASSYAYSLGNREGYSDEKVNPRLADAASNWTNSLTLHGTPGSRNSVTPPDHDLAIVRFVSNPTAPQVLDSFSLSIVVANLGLMAANDSLILNERLDSAAPEDTIRHIASWKIDGLASGDSLFFDSRMRLPDNRAHQYVAELTAGDDRPGNDLRTLRLNSTSTGPALVINELMYAPEPQRSEWIELQNISGMALDLSGWTFCDGTGLADTTRRLTLPPMSVSSRQFVILAADSSIFFENIPTSAPIVVWNSTPITCNNTGDSLAVFDADRHLIDRLDYRSSWGNSAGISLERISISAPTNDRLNWASSLDSTGSTPGRLNSRAFPENAESRDLLTLEPNPFTPNGDGRDDVLAIHFRLDHPDSRLDLKIYDVRGRQVRFLANNEAAGYSGQRLWDGKDDHGRDLPTGIYIVYLEALGKGGTRIQSDRRVVALARPS
jgi:hypothetical protein